MTVKFSAAARAIASAPIVSPLVDLLQHRTTIVIVIGVVLLLGLPYYPGITPARLDLLTNVIVAAMGLLGVRFSIEGVMQARADLSRLVEDVSSNIDSSDSGVG